MMDGGIAATGDSSSSRSGFTRELPDGTTIYGPKETEGRPGHKHGHEGDDFSRTPHSTIGSAALGDAHTTKDHPTERT